MHNNQRDGMHRQAVHRGRVAYEPNSLAGGCPFQAGSAGFNSFPQHVADDKVRGKPEKFAEHFALARMFWISQTPTEQAHIVGAFRFELTRVQTPAVRERLVSMLANVDPILCAGVADGLGIEVPAPMPRATGQAAPDYAISPALSLMFRPGITGIKTRRIALLASHGVNSVTARAVYGALLNEGAVPRMVGHQLGKLRAADGSVLEVEISLEAGTSVLYDAVVILDGADSALDLARNAASLEFVRLQHRHCKPILALGSGVALLEAAGLPTSLPDGSADPAMIIDEGAQLATALLQFKAALAAHREFARETDPPTS